MTDLFDQRAHKKRAEEHFKVACVLVGGKGQDLVNYHHWWRLNYLGKAESSHHP
jgi:hypothetical protein